MQTVNNLFVMSFFVSGLTGLMLIGLIFSSWLAIEILSVVIGITG